VVRQIITRVKNRWCEMTLKDKSLSGIAVIMVVVFSILLTLTASGKIGLLIVKSGSMTPQMQPGSLLVFKAAGIDDVKAGEIIVFREDRFSNALVTHRAVDKVFDGGKLYIKTRGDNNHRPDTMLVGKDELMGKTIYIIPQAGYILAFTKTPVGLLVLNFMLAFFVLLLVVDKIRAAERMALSSDDGM